MSITRQIAEEQQKRREEADKAMEEFIAKGGKITVIDEGVTTEAKDMKYKYRRMMPKKKEEE